MSSIVKNEILGVTISDITKGNALEYVLHSVKTGQKKVMIFTPNPEIVVYAQAHPEYKRLLNEADLTLCDGVGLMFAADIMGKPFKERITGVDFMEQLCSMASKNRMSIGLLGGRRGVAERASKCLREKYKNLKIVFTAEEWGIDGFKINDLRFKNKEKIIHHKSSFVNLPQIDILFVAYGFPKQEQWIKAHLSELPVRAAMGVGGAFDYFSGNVQRAPFLIRAVGLEWLFRLIRQPWRAKRQLALLTFIRLVLKERFFQ